MQFPYAEVEFNADGTVRDPAQLAAAVDMVRSAGATDVLVLAHGWNSDIPAARNLYDNLTDSLAAVRDRVPEAEGRKIAVIGALWPSLRWAEDAGVSPRLTAPTSVVALQERIHEAVEDGPTAARLKALAPQLETSPEARAEFLDLLRGMLPPAGENDEDPPPDTFVSGDPDDAFDAASGAGQLAPRAGLPGIGDIIRGGRNLLNLTTFYTMKDRAGKVGEVGVADLLDAIATGAPDARVHLAGHSFGARVVSAAADATQHPVGSLTLLQGAFSHYGFATDYDGRDGNGRFQPVLAPGRLTGPLLVTHTANDKAVGLAYAVASRLAGQARPEVGGPGDPYGGIGRNGALKTPEVFLPATDLQEVGGDYPFVAGRVHNLKADRFISSHGDVTGEEVAYALLRAMVT